MYVCVYVCLCGTYYQTSSKIIPIFLFQSIIFFFFFSFSLLYFNIFLLTLTKMDGHCLDKQGAEVDARNE